MSMIPLGATVRDLVTKSEGVVIARYEYLHGCTRLCVQPREVKEGKPVEPFTEDEQRFELLDLPNILEIAPPTNKPGGDRPSAPARPAPSRY